MQLVVKLNTQLVGEISGRIDGGGHWRSRRRIDGGEEKRNNVEEQRRVKKLGFGVVIFSEFTVIK